MGRAAGIQIPEQREHCSHLAVRKLRARRSAIHPRSPSQEESGKGQEPGLPTSRAGLFPAQLVVSATGSALPKCTAPVWQGCPMARVLLDKLLRALTPASLL